jgi:hypothetical protein
MKNDPIREKQAEIIDKLLENIAHVRTMWTLSSNDDKSKMEKENLWKEYKQLKSELSSLIEAEKEEKKNPVCEICEYQNSENCNTCDILNPQFR